MNRVNYLSGGIRRESSPSRTHARNRPADSSRTSLLSFSSSRHTCSVFSVHWKRVHTTCLPPNLWQFQSWAMQRTAYTRTHTHAHTDAHTHSLSPSLSFSRYFPSLFSCSLLSLLHTHTHTHAYQQPAHCSTLQHTAAHCNTLQHTATHCSPLQPTAAHCNTLQHTATNLHTHTHAHLW